MMWVLDTEEDCHPVGYDIQHARRKRKLIAKLVLVEWAGAVD